MSGTAAQARGHASHAEGSALETVQLAALPIEAQNLHRLILDGGPFPAGSKDGVVFANREQLLPREPRGFYREYTVPTPGAHDRGARRIVCGGTPPADTLICYYTGDHYASFREIVQ
ncbi:MAG: ribonuclease [Pseudomonadota bacterium]|nr:ribonuclease [Pseudomonadota bacterium]